MTQLFANPYNIDAQGFYFESYEDYQDKSETHTDRFGKPVEEYSIEYIDGDNSALFNAASIRQGDIETWFEQLDHLDDSDDAAIAIQYLTEIIGLDLQRAIEQHDSVNIFHGTKEEYAEEFVSECYDLSAMGNLAQYFDYEAFARDLELSGDIYEYDRTTIITNPQDF